MDSITRFEPFDELDRFDHLLTRIDPALEIDVFNSFMQRPVLTAETLPKCKAKHSSNQLCGNTEN